MKPTVGFLVLAAFVILASVAATVVARLAETYWIARLFAPLVQP